jgi:GNAT superfamily N-acetyltransferase
MIRPATPGDIPRIHALVLELAVYERLQHQAVVTQEQLQASLFGSGSPQAEALVVEVTPADIVGFALFFHNYSTFLGRRGLYLEDLFVLPQERRKGHGRALLQELARIAIERGCGRFEWSVLAWNEPAIQFYRSLGAEQLEDWRIFRLTGPDLHRLALRPSAPGIAPGDG